MNRIHLGIEKALKAIEARNLSPEKLADVSKKLDMELVEYCKFQELKSAAVGTRLTLEEANTIYGYLGNTVEHFN